MAKLRKMLRSIDSPEIISLMHLIETQNKMTIATWCVNYAKEHILPIYQKSFPKDQRLLQAINGALDYLEGTIKLPAAKKLISEAQTAARETKENPIAQAAARAVAQACATIHKSTNALALAFYGSAAIAYDRVGLLETKETYDEIATEEFHRLEEALRSIAIENEPNPAKINWHC